MRALILAAALSLGACQTLPQLSSGAPAAAVGENVLVLGVNALADAADVYAVVANTTAAAINKGAFTDAQVRQIQAANRRAGALLDGTVQGLSVAQRAAELTSIIGLLRGFGGGK